MDWNKLPKEVLYTLAFDFDLPDILSTCLISKRFNNYICNSDDFWNIKLLKV